MATVRVKVEATRKKWQEMEMYFDTPPSTRSIIDRSRHHKQKVQMDSNVESQLAG